MVPVRPRVTNLRYRLVVVLVTAVSATLAGPALVAGDSPTADVLTVDDSSGADFGSIQAAVDAADPGDTVRVHPGVYAETVTVDVGVRLTAPQDAVLDGSALSDEAVAFRIRGDVAPVIDGFTIRHYNVGVRASSPADWTLRDTVVRNASWKAVSAAGTEGDWRIHGVTVVNSDAGVAAVSSSGDWTITETTVRNVTEGNGIDAQASSGDWTLRRVSLVDVSFAAVAASFSTGDWRVANSTIRDATVGIGAIETGGNWTVNGSTIRDGSVSDRYDFWQPRLKEGVGVYAPRTNGSWAVHHTRFANNARGAIVAPGASPPGDATSNRWTGSAASTSERCVGNVDCRATTDPEAADDSTPARTPADGPPREGRRTETNVTGTASRGTAVSGGTRAPSQPRTSVVSLLLVGVAGVAAGVVLAVRSLE